MARSEEGGPPAHLTGGIPGRVEVFASAELPTRAGEFRVVAFRRGDRLLDDVALVRGEPAGIPAVPTRVHSECLTGDTFGSLRCDCRDQLQLGLDALASFSVSLLVYLRQEGRGIGLANKVAAYALQDQGLDTFEANRHLGFDDDPRDYTIAADILGALGVQSIVLLTNNPRKVFGLRQHGIDV
jgi:GTP cyclohydrolase II